LPAAAPQIKPMDLPVSAPWPPNSPTEPSLEPVVLAELRPGVIDNLSLLPTELSPTRTD
ncbi:hypothetical protein PHYSODRAFT_454980, partial [Phytophthora sojae]